MKQKAKKKRNFGKISLPTTFPKYIHANFLSIANADKEQSNLFKELCEMSKGEKLLEKLPFIENVILLLDAREKVVNSFKSNLFPTENSAPDPIPNPAPHPPVFYLPKQAISLPKIKISPFKLNENFLCEIRNDEENINSELFWVFC